MENLDNVLYSLIPLILILVLSWLFGFLGARKRKETEGAEDSGSPRVADQFFDFFARDQEGEEVRREGPPRVADVRKVSLDSLRTGQPAMRGPEISAKPIEPRWWGA